RLFAEVLREAQMEPRRGPEELFERDVERGDDLASGVARDVEDVIANGRRLPVEVGVRRVDRAREEDRADRLAAAKAGRDLFERLAPGPDPRADVDEMHVERRTRGEERREGRIRADGAHARDRALHGAQLVDLAEHGAEDGGVMLDRNALEDLLEPLDRDARALLTPLELAQPVCTAAIDEGQAEERSAARRVIPTGR